MKLCALLVLIFGFNGPLRAAIEAAYDGVNGVRNKVFTVCMQCHSSTLTGAARNGSPTIVNFDSYADAALWGDVAVRRAGVEGSMPPQSVQPLDQEQRDALIAWQAAGFPEKLTPPPTPRDAQAPTTPAGVTATALGISQINLHWAASADNVGVTSYKIYRGNVLTATLDNVTSFSDRGLGASTAYAYGVAACDAAGNCSAPSVAIVAITQNQSDCLFNWAETSYPEYLSPRVQSLSAAPYYFRYYPPATYLAISASRLLYLGPLSASVILDLGDVASWYFNSGCV